MTYTVSSGTLNSTIPYHSEGEAVSLSFLPALQCQWPKSRAKIRTEQDTVKLSWCRFTALALTVHLAT